MRTSAICLAFLLAALFGFPAAAEPDAGEFRIRIGSDDDQEAAALEDDSVPEGEPIRVDDGEAPSRVRPIRIEPELPPEMAPPEPADEPVAAPAAPPVEKKARPKRRKRRRPRMKLRGTGGEGKKTLWGVVETVTPARAAEARVSIRGDELELPDRVHFHHDSLRFQKGADGVLRQVADKLQASPEIGLLMIEGHTDRTGSMRYNQKLSEARASAVREALVKLGVAPERVVAYGYGETRAAGRARSKQRRVVFRLVRADRRALSRRAATEWGQAAVVGVWGEVVWAPSPESSPVPTALRRWLPRGALASNNQGDPGLPGAADAPVASDAVPPVTPEPEEPAGAVAPTEPAPDAAAAIEPGAEPVAAPAVEPAITPDAAAPIEPEAVPDAAVEPSADAAAPIEPEAAPDAGVAPVADAALLNAADATLDFDEAIDVDEAAENRADAGAAPASEVDGGGTPAAVVEPAPGGEPEAADEATAPESEPESDRAAEPTPVAEPEAAEPESDSAAEPTPVAEPESAEKSPEQPAEPTPVAEPEAAEKPAGQPAEPTPVAEPEAAEEPADAAEAPNPGPELAWQPLAFKDQLGEGVDIETRAGARAVLRLPDLTRIALDPDTRIRISKLFYDASGGKAYTAIRLRRGALHVMANPMERGGSQTLIAFEGGSLDVVAADFDIASNGRGYGRLTVRRGSLKVADGSAESVSMSTGQSLQLGPEGNPLPVSLLRPPEIVGPLRGGVAPQPTLEWKSVEEAARYLVEVAEDVTFYQTRAARWADGVSMPLEGDFEPGKLLYWRVSAHAADGRPGQYSRVYGFQVQKTAEPAEKPAAPNPPRGG